MNKRKILVYVAGKYSGEISGNIHAARETAIKLWESGFSVFCPHLNTIHFEKDCKCRYNDYIMGDLEILERCDVILMLDNWESSQGATREHEFAQSQQIPIFYKIEDLERWYNEKPTVCNQP
ncbi:MAG TPA: DUF4406 domain-containing protein [Candidatus Omnitrophota bacterium]|nr:DUF4406 domain-containing protein [Candidatus Omnitrophota bacterium]